LLRIEAVTRDGLIVRRALDADPRTGLRLWTDRRFVFKNHEDAELGYAVTDHATHGRTVTAALAVITGTEDRQHAYVFTASPKRADPVPGPRPAPELARYDKIYAERAGVPVPATAPAAPGTALSVLAAVLEHDGQQQSAIQTRNQALADADHLALLHAIWTAETGPAREQRYRNLLAVALPGHHAAPGPGTGGYGGPCTAPNSPAWTPRKSSPTRSANETSPVPATSLASTSRRCGRPNPGRPPVPSVPGSR
jgi:hypothetical protein